MHVNIHVSYNYILYFSNFNLSRNIIIVIILIVWVEPLSQINELAFNNLALFL